MHSHKIKKEMQRLNEKRRIFISTQQSQGSSELQNAMLNALKKQANKKNYEWNLIKKPDSRVSLFY